MHGRKGIKWPFKWYLFFVYSVQHTQEARLVLWVYRTIYGRITNVQDTGRHILLSRPGGLLQNANSEVWTRV